MLADSDAKIINVAHESGYRHLGLFNAMFKKRFGLTPSKWRKQNTRKGSAARRESAVPDGGERRPGFRALVFFRADRSAQTGAMPGDTPRWPQRARRCCRKWTERKGRQKSTLCRTPPTARISAWTDICWKATPLLKPGDISAVFTNVPAAFGTNVSFDAIRAVLGDLQMAYRERGFATVSVGLPQQKLTNATLKVKVTEGRLADIRVTGNRWFSSNNVMSALPSLHPDMLLNSHVFQRELDLANANRDRQIYPVIGPGLEPGTSELTLEGEGPFPVARASGSQQHAHARHAGPAGEFQFAIRQSVGNGASGWNSIQRHPFEQYSEKNDFNWSPLDSPLIANYSGYYRIPLGHHGVGAGTD